MYIEGIVYAIDEQNIKVKLQLPSYDGFVTEWLSVPQLFCVGNKARKSLPMEGSLVAAILDEDMAQGAILGALYNDEDEIPENLSNDFIQFEDGSTLSHNEDEGGFLVVKNLRVEGDIIASGQVSDGKSSMQDMRDVYNSHNHSNGNNGESTGAADR